MIRRVGLISMVAGATMFGLVTSAQGATVVGQTATPSECAGPDFGQVQLSTAGPPTYTIPFDGTVTSFSAGTLSAGPQTKLLILQPVAGDTFQVVAKSDFVTFTVPNGVQTFSTQIPVQAGEVIGQYGQVCALASTMTPGDAFGFFEDAEPATGANQSFPNPSDPRIDISATVEPPAATQPPVAKTKCKKKKHKRSAESAKKKKCKKKKK
jgi:hypothetical protein